jgi:hypothetical protein
MFKILLVMCVGLALTAGTALAWGGNPAALAPQVFANQSTSATSSVVNVTNFRTKTLSVQGVAVSGHSNTTLSGTVAALCGPTAAGPFVACSGLITTAAGAAVSTTSNATLTWTDSAQFMEVQYTKTSGECSVWLSLGN